MNKAVFLDRDGLINQKLENDYVKIWEEFHFLPGVKEAVKILNEKEYLVVVVTNQTVDLREGMRRSIEWCRKNGIEI